MAKASYNSRTYPTKLNKRESKVVETSVIQAKEDIDVENLGAGEGEILTEADSNGKVKAKTLKAGTNVTITQTSEEITITAAGGSGTGSPGGNDTTIQYNDAGSFNGDDEFKWDATDKAINLDGLKIDKLSDPVTLNNDQSSPAQIFSMSASENKYMVIEYSIERGSHNQIGRLLIVNNGSNASVSDDYVNTNDLGITFSVDISASNVILSYTSTNTGNTGTLKLVKRRWA